MSKETTGRYLSHDGQSQIYYRILYPDGTPRAVVQICHGMTEFFDRYIPFARYLTEKGVIVCGNDHLGHGKSGPEGVRGYFAEQGGPVHLCADVDALNRMVRGKYPNLPYILLGHSMGSFIARRYMVRCRDHIDGVILSGTSGGGSVERMGLWLASVLGRIRGGRAISPLVANMVNGSFTKRFRGQGKYAWLTRDADIRRQYEADPNCTFPFTLGGYRDMFSMLCEVNSDDWFRSVAQDLPILLISGENDPVGAYGAGVRRVYERLRGQEICELSLKLYPEARHEVLNEINREEVYADILAFVDATAEGVIALRTGGIPCGF